MNKYRKDHCGRHLLDDYTRLEMEREERIVWQNDGFLVVCPWWAVWPFEVLLLPKRHVRALVDLNKTERLQFAEAILQVARSYDKLFGFSFPYSMYLRPQAIISSKDLRLTYPVSGLHQAPLDATEVELDSSYLHMHFCPPLLRSSVRKFFGGYELFAEPSREITPEAAAACLRGSGAQVSVSPTECKAVESQVPVGVSGRETPGN
jgi:UDPglucose--hexose-1-phosphate uridylyltransferase